MITEQDLREAIAECEGKRNPDSGTCIKLAAFYTIRDQLFGDKTISEPMPLRSFAAPPESARNVVEYSGKSEFSQAISGMDSYKAWEIMDELMEALSVINPRLYDSVMRKLK